MLHHHERVALGLELLEDIEEDAVVAVVQADGGLVEDVADAAQVRAELRREPDALRLAARERRRGAIAREITEADFLQKAEPGIELGQDVARDLGLASADR